MIRLFFSVAAYSFVHALAQIILKIGLSQIGAFSAHNINQMLQLLLKLIKNPFILGGTFLFAASYLFWVAILSCFKVSLAFPLYSMSFIFAAFFAYFILNEKLFFYNYLGILIIAIGIILLLYKQG